MTIKQVVDKGRTEEVAEEDNLVAAPSAPASSFDHPSTFNPGTNYDEVPFAQALELPPPSGGTFPVYDTATTQSPTATSTVVTSTNPVVVVPGAPHPPTGQGSPIPEGARWITVSFIGGTTWSICAIVSTITCCMTACPCGVWAFLCPCDEIRAYEVNGQVFDEFGRPLGSIYDLRVRR